MKSALEVVPSSSVLRQIDLDRKTEVLPDFELLTPENILVSSCVKFQEKKWGMFDLVVYLASSSRSNLIKVWYRRFIV